MHRRNFLHRFIAGAVGLVAAKLGFATAKAEAKVEAKFVETGMVMVGPTATRLYEFQGTLDQLRDLIGRLAMSADPDFPWLRCVDVDVQRTTKSEPVGHRLKWSFADEKFLVTARFEPLPFCYPNPRS